MIMILIAFGMFVLIVASTWWFGLWSNFITLINVLLASMLASSIYEPVAGQLLSINRSYQRLFDFIAVWLVFCLAYFILRGITDVLSAYRLKFDPLTEMIGRSVLSVWIAGVFICFSFFTMQMAPLTPAFYGRKSPATLPSEVGTIPDKLWLAFIQSRSRGALSAGQQSKLFPEYRYTEHPDDAGQNKRVFDPHGNWLFDMEARRWNLSKQTKLRGN
ncbi:MAG: hypothetical protein P8J27_15280 [Mariniblastus sp.]|nr:hypothetical protein [Mariniblastus sp.]